MIEAPARILVVDDVAENVRLLNALLTSRGYVVISASDGASSLNLVASAAPDLVLLDVMMPPRLTARRSRRSLPTSSKSWWAILDSNQ